MLIRYCDYRRAFFAGSNSNVLAVRDIIQDKGIVKGLIWFVVVIFLTFGGYSLILARTFRTKYFLLINLSIIVLIFISIGGTLDFSMRATVPAYFLIMIYIIMYTNSDEFIKGMGLRNVALVSALCISFITVWLCFSSLLKQALEAKTIFVPKESELIYSFEGKSDKWDYNLIDQYTKSNLVNDYFFNHLFQLKHLNYQYPVIEKEADENGRLRIKKATLSKEMIDDFIMLVAEEDKEFAMQEILKKIEESGYSVVLFSKGILMQEDVKIADGDLDIEWENYRKNIDICNNKTIVNLKVTNNSSKVIPVSSMIENDKGIGIYASLSYKNGENYLIPISMRKIGRIIFPGESVYIPFAIPQNAATTGEYFLNFGIYQIEERDTILTSTMYTTTTERKYEVFYQ